MLSSCDFESNEFNFNKILLILFSKNTDLDYLENKPQGYY